MGPIVALTCAAERCWRVLRGAPFGVSVLVGHHPCYGLLMADSLAEVFSAAKFRDRHAASELNGRNLADRLGVTPTSVGSLRSGRTSPSMDLLCRIVEVLGGSVVDYLDLPSRDRWGLRHFRYAAGLTQQAVAEELGVSRVLVTGWESRRSKPPQQMMVRLAELYGAEDSELAAVVNRQPAVNAAQGLLIAARSVSAIAAVSVEMLAAMEADRRHDFVITIRDELERTLEALAGAVRELQEDAAREDAVKIVGRLAALHADLALRSK